MLTQALELIRNEEVCVRYPLFQDKDNAGHFLLRRVLLVRFFMGGFVILLLDFFVLRLGLLIILWCALYCKKRLIHNKRKAYR